MSKEAIFVMQQLPWKTQNPRHVTLDDDKALSRWMSPPCLHHIFCSGTEAHHFVESLADLNQQSLHLLATLCKPFIGPLPVLLQVPAQIVTFLLRQWVFEWVAFIM